MSGQTLYPLVFKPLLKENVWGGERLADLGKTLRPGRPHGESWEIVDLATDQSVVADGPLAGRTLHDLVEEQPAALLGPVALDGGRFPLLVKYIDAAQKLSVQVHPDEASVALLGHGRPKNEAWYVLDAEPGAVVYLGLKPGVGRAELERELSDGGEIGALLEAVEVSPGDLIPVLPGTVHAIGAGVLLAEVQQPSDTTFRVYDWGRLGLDGKPRQLHVAEALACIDFERRVDLGLTRLDAGHFKVEVVSPEPGNGASLEGEGPRVVVGLEGQLTIETEAAPTRSVARGSAVLLPHCLGDASLVTAPGPQARALVVSF